MDTNTTLQTLDALEPLLKITPTHYLVLAVLLFVAGIIGVMLRKNLLIIFMSIELMLNAVNLVFVTFANSLGNEAGQVAVLLVMTVAAAEAAIGLAIFVALFRNRETVYLDSFTDLRN